MVQAKILRVELTKGRETKRSSTRLFWLCPEQSLAFEISHLHELGNLSANEQGNAVFVIGQVDPKKTRFFDYFLTQPLDMALVGQLKRGQSGRF